MIVCDVDNTLADVNAVLRERFPGNAERESVCHWAPVPEGYFATPGGLDAMAIALPYPGAAEMLSTLARVEPVYYLTARPTCAAMLTTQWLSRHHFPDGAVLADCGPVRKAAAAVELGACLGLDDDPQAAWRYRVAGIPCCLYSQPYNARDFCAFTRWRDLRGVLDAAGCGDLVARAFPRRGWVVGAAPGA